MRSSLLNPRPESGKAMHRNTLTVEIALLAIHRMPVKTAITLKQESMNAFRAAAEELSHVICVYSLKQH